MQYPFQCPKTAYSLGDVLHHSTGQGDIWMLLVIDVLYQVQKPLFPLSMHQIQREEGLILPVEQVFYEFAVLRDTKPPHTVGHMLTIVAEDIDTSPIPGYPWTKIGSRPDWVAHFHPHAWCEEKTVSFDLTDLIALQAEQAQKESLLEKPRVSATRLYAEYLLKYRKER
jgi:hypothetical protein